MACPPRPNSATDDPPPTPIRAPQKLHAMHRRQAALEAQSARIAAVLAQACGCIGLEPVDLGFPPPPSPKRRRVEGAGAPCPRCARTRPPERGNPRRCAGHPGAGGAETPPPPATRSRARTLAPLEFQYRGAPG